MICNQPNSKSTYEQVISNAIRNINDMINFNYNCCRNTTELKYNAQAYAAGSHLSLIHFRTFLLHFSSSVDGNCVDKGDICSGSSAKAKLILLKPSRSERIIHSASHVTKQLLNQF